MSMSGQVTRAGRLLPITAILLVLSAGSLTAQIEPAEYAARRAELSEQLGDGLYFFRAEVAPNGRQDPDFNYLTGINGAGAHLLMLRQGDDLAEALFVRGAPDPESGFRSMEEFDQVLAEMVRSRPRRTTPDDIRADTPRFKSVGTGTGQSGRRPPSDARHKIPGRD